MRVALVSTEKLPVPPIRSGAIQTYIDGILPFLADEHEVTVFGVADPDLPLREETGRCRMIRLPAEGYPRRVAEELSREPFDLVQVFNRPLWVEAFHRATPRSRMILSLHNEMFTEEKIGARDALRCLELCERVITVSRFIAGGIVQRFPEAEGKVRVIYSGVDPAAYVPRWHRRAPEIREAVAARWGFSPEDPVILCVSRLSPKKGQHVLIQAMPEILRRHPSARLLLVGSKWYGRTEWDDYGLSLKEAAARSGGRVILTGFVPVAEIPPFFTAGDVFVCASQWQEPLARVHYEAMAGGLPIVTTRRGGNPEVVDGLGTGWVVNDYSDPVAMGQHIAHLLDQRELALAMGLRGRGLAEERFCWRRVAREVLELYGEGPA